MGSIAARRALALAALPLLLLCAVRAAEHADVAPFKAWPEVKPEEQRKFQFQQPERIALANGMVVFLLENHELPLIDCSMTIRFGSVQDPDAQAGRAAILAEVMRSGGSAEFPGDKLDEALESKAASLWINAGLDSGSAGCACLKEDFDQIFGILMSVLRVPAFPQEKIDLALMQARTRVAKRNDSPAAVANREFAKALYGSKEGRVSPWARYPEFATLGAIARQDLIDCHKASIHPGRFILSVTGDFDKARMREKIDKAFAAWPAGEKAPENPRVDMKREARIYYVDRPALNQSTILFGHPLDLRRDHPDFPALMLASEVLSGGMSARLFTEVRTKKGLAYSVWGAAQVNFDRPGLFTCSCTTRNEQALEAVEAVRAEVVRLKEEGVRPKELESARESVLNSFVFNYDTPEKIAARVRTYEYYGYPLDFDGKYIEALSAATLEDVNRAAKKYLEPGKLTILEVGNGAPPVKEFEKYGKFEILDVSIPVAPAKPMVLDPEREARGKKWLEEALTAAGGVNAFAAIVGIRSDLLMHVGPLKLTTVMRVAVPDRVRADVAGPFGAVTQILGKEGGWQASGSWVKEIKREEAAKNLRAITQTDLGVLRVLASAKEGYNVQALDPVRDGERLFQAVMVESASLGRVKLYFDGSTKLLAKLRYTLENDPKEYEKVFLEHKTYGPFTLARRIEDNDPKARAKTVEMLGLQVNPKLDDALFEKPERATPPPEPLRE
ncbi:MAG: insulinase family protein [Planctomycetes bacterium]|nr:insulinase family protein [Planctomycetota bacterium]